MNSKFYVSFEAEELLIEKGCPIKKNIPIYNKHRDVIGCYPADRPTKAEAIDWLESKKVYVEIHGIGREENRRYCYTIFSQETSFGIESKYIFPTRLEAEDAAIIKALELL